jgi:hypothetical protein
VTHGDTADRISPVRTRDAGAQPRRRPDAPARAMRRLDTAVFLDVDLFSFEHFTNGATIQYREMFRRLIGSGVRCAIITALWEKGARLAPAAPEARRRNWILLRGIPVLELRLPGATEAAPDVYLAAIEQAISALAPDLIIVNTPPDRLEEVDARLFEWLAQRREQVLCFVPDAAFSGNDPPRGRLERLRAALARLPLAAPSRFIADEVRSRLGLAAKYFPNLFDERKITRHPSVW